MGDTGTHQSYDDYVVSVESCQCELLFKGYFGGNTNYCYKQELKGMYDRARKMVGMHLPVLQMPFIVQDDAYPMWVNVVSLVGEPINGGCADSRLIIVWLSVVFENDLTVKISDLVKRLEWTIMSEDFEI